MRGDLSDYVRSLEAHQRALFVRANRTQDNYDKQRKQYFDKGRDDMSLKVGDFVTHYVGDGRVGRKKKFQPRWRGTWKIVRRFGNNAMEIEELRTKEKKTVNRSKVKVIFWHMDQLI